MMVKDNEEGVFWAPQPRGGRGHQLCIDSGQQNIYMFGGCDGTRDLAEFWKYNITSGKWSLLSGDTAAEGGPGPRSCHTMMLDPKYRQIFVLGRYLERGLWDTQANTQSDFYVYDIGAGEWTMITNDTSAVGGPDLNYEHQMCLDPERRAIYVFVGNTLLMQTPTGRLQERPAADKNVSGLFVYHIHDNTWRVLCDDRDSAPASPDSLIDNLLQVDGALDFEIENCPKCSMHFTGKDRKRKMLTHLMSRHYKTEFNEITPSPVGEYYCCTLKDCDYKTKLKLKLKLN